MYYSLDYYDFVPKLVPEKMIGTIKRKIWLKKDHVKRDGTSALYIELYQKVNAKIFRKRINLQISVPFKYFDQKKQRIKTTYKFASDYNLLIEKKLADINSIEVNYRLLDEELTVPKLLQNLNNPQLRVNFYSFWDDLMNYQKDEKIIKHETFKQQNATLNKIKEFRQILLFKDITEDYINELRAWLKNTKKQAPATIEIVFKNFKKYLHAANKKGIRTPVTFDKIKVKKTDSNFTFLMPSEVKRIHQLYKNPNISHLWKSILQRYLFSCFTGLRISDVLRLNEDNFIDGVLIFVSHKSGKLQRIKLNETAKSFVEMPSVFSGTYCEQVGNRELKLIAEACDIKKRLYYHSSRHTFATNYLLKGGQLRHLQKTLGHSKIETTMVYAHAVEAFADKEIDNLDDIIL